MNDLIYRDGVIEALTELHNNVDVWEVKVGISEAIHAINKLPSADAVPLCDDCTKCAVKALNRPPAEAVQGWIPCSERLPEDGDEVLVTDANGNIRHVYRDDLNDEELFATWEDGMHIVAIAWMPLPKPYKGGEE